MDEASAKDLKPSPSLVVRTEVRELLIVGDVAGAMSLVNSRFPGLLASSAKPMAYLRCQEFIEHVRAGRRDEALATAQLHIAPLLHQDPPPVSNGASSSSSRSEHGNGSSGNGAAGGGGGRLLDEEGRGMVQSVVGLLAYADPRESPLAQVYDESHRRVVADALNSAILRESLDAPKNHSPAPCTRNNTLAPPLSVIVVHVY